MTEYRVSDKLRDIIKNESRTVAIQTEALGQLERAMEALQGIEVSVEKGFVGSEDADYISVVVYGSSFFTPYERGYRDLSADDYMTFDEAFESIPESNEPKEQDTPNDRLFESQGPLGEAPKPEPGVKYLWESHRNNQGVGGKVVLFMHKEEGVMGMGISGLRWYENLEQAQDDADTHLTVEELEEQGYNLEGFFFHPLEQEPERFIWVSNEPVPHILGKSENQSGLWLETYHKGGDDSYQKYASFHLTEDEVEDSMYDTRKFTKKPITRPVVEPTEELKVTYKFTDRFNELRGKEPFTIDVGYQAQADTLVDLLGGRNKVDGKYEEGIVELYFYREMALNPDFLNFVSDEVPNLSFEEAVEAV